MKFRVAILILLVSSTHFKSIDCAKKLDINGVKNMLKPMSKTCKQKTGVTDELLAGTLDGVWPNERSLMCYFKCMAVLLKGMNKEGEITLSEMNRQLDALVIEELVTRVKEILGICLKTTAPSIDACEYAFNIIQCGYNTDPSMYFLP